MKWDWSEFVRWVIIEVYILLLYWCLWCRQFYYIIDFLFVNMGGLRWVLSTDHRDHSLLYEHELFSCSLKKIFDWTTTWQMTFLLCSRFRVFTCLWKISNLKFVLEVLNQFWQILIVYCQKRSFSWVINLT